MDTTPQTAVTWMVDGVAVNTSSGRIYTDGATLNFSPLAISDTGYYTCILTVTATQTYGIIQGEIQSLEEIIYITGIQLKGTPYCITKLKPMSSPDNVCLVHAYDFLCYFMGEWVGTIDV